MEPFKKGVYCLKIQLAVRGANVFIGLIHIGIGIKKEKSNVSAPEILAIYMYLKYKNIEIAN